MAIEEAQDLVVRTERMTPPKDPECRDRVFLGDRMLGEIYRVYSRWVAYHPGIPKATTGHKRRRDALRSLIWMEKNQDWIPKRDKTWHETRRRRWRR